jgi:hypothetical protein
VIDAASGNTITRRPMSEDTGTPTQGTTSDGVSIAEHTVFASASEVPTATGTAVAGLIVAYRTG